MKKFFYHLFLVLPLCLVIVACSEANDDEPDPMPPTQLDPEEPEDPEEPVETIIPDLSAAEMANCYIVQQPGVYKFKADNQFNLGEGLPVPPKIDPFAAKLVWQTVKGSISSIELNQGDGNTPYITFEVKNPSGNAVIAALDSYGNIVWSWHIWMPETEVQSITMSNGYQVMNMNLGASNNEAGNPLSYGLLYQWGRKDPFPAAASLTGDTQTVSAPMYDINNEPVTIINSSWTDTEANTLQYSIANPTVCLSNYSQYFTSRDWLVESDDTLWGNPNGYDSESDNIKFPSSGKKTCYDPSPAGWRVSPADAFSSFTTSGGYSWDFSEFNVKDINEDEVLDLEDFIYGWFFIVNENEASYFPAASRFDGSYAMLMGSMSGLWGNYWSNSPSKSIPGGAFCCLSFQILGQNGENYITVSPAASASKADAYSIRCIRDIK